MTTCPHCLELEKELQSARLALDFACTEQVRLRNVIRDALKELAPVHGTPIAEYFYTDSGEQAPPGFTRIAERENCAFHGLRGCPTSGVWYKKEAFESE